MTTFRYDPHWRPYSLSCSACMMPYNNIIHFEHLKQEESWIIKKLSAGNILGHRYIFNNIGLKCNITFFSYTRWENRDKDGEVTSREKLLFKYFNLLDDDEIQDLYNIYENDFKLFGYNFQFRDLRLNI